MGVSGVGVNIKHIGISLTVCHNYPIFLYYYLEKKTSRKLGSAETQLWK